MWVVGWVRDARTLCRMDDGYVWVWVGMWEIQCYCVGLISV